MHLLRWNIRLNWRYLVMLLLSLQIFSLKAKQSDPLQSLIQLITQQQYQQAYQLALELFEQHAGEDDYDFLLGVAAQGSNHYNQAVFAFERVVNTKPNWLAARFALATSYFANGNLLAAKQQFMLLSDKNFAQQEQVTLFLQQIEQQLTQQVSHWRHQITLASGYDDNVNSGVDINQIQLPGLGSIDLFEQSKAQNSLLWQLNWTSHYQASISQQQAWFAQASIEHSAFTQAREFNQISGYLSLGWQHKFQRAEVKAQAFFQPLWLDSAHYVSYWGGLFSLDYAWQKQQRIGADLLLAQLDFEQNIQNKKQLAITPWFSIADGAWYHKITFPLGREYAQYRDDLARDFYGIGYQISYQLASKQLLSLKLSYNKANYQQIQPLFLTKRQDKRWQSQLVYSYQLPDNWLFSTKLILINNQSNAALYDFQRRAIYLSLQHQF